MWQEKDNTLYKKFSFDRYAKAGNFIDAIAELSDELNHHPEKIELQWGSVEVWLTTHDAGNQVSDRDRKLSSEIDKIYTPKQSNNDATSHQSIARAKLYTDGGSRGNPGPSAVGYVILNMDDTVVKKEGFYLGITTNNQAEYQGLKQGLEQAKALGIRGLTVYMDSLLVVNQMNGIYKVKNRDLWPIHKSAKDLAQTFSDISFVHVPRELNGIADGLVNDTLDANS